MSPTDKVNILLVDDQLSKLLSYEVILGELGENLIKASSANEALEHLLKNDIAVVLVDVCMPDLDGFELAQMIREHPRFQNTAIIFVSAILMTDFDLLRGYKLGAVDYVPIPVVPDLLRAKVRVFAELYRKTTQLELLNSELERRVAERTAALERANEELERANQELEQRVEERTREREAALAKIHEMQKLESLGQLTGGVAHDFNNLLTVMLANLSLLRKRVPDDPRIIRLIDGALQSAERGATLTNRMLAFARRQDLKPEMVDLAKLVDGMAEMLRRSLGPAIQIHTEFRAGLAAVHVDPNQFELALLNLALNARDAMPLGGTLAIGARGADASEGPPGLAAGHYVRVVVTDTGTGMDEDTLKRAAEPFFTTKGVGKGTGLGLSMVHGLAAQSDGAMRITSRPGQGTTVELWLPAAQRATASALPPAPGHAPRSGQAHQVLLVDDDPLILLSTAALLEDFGHTVIQASSGASALEVLHKGEAVDLIITDQAMPGMLGTELVRKVRETWPELPIILASGYADLPPGEDPRVPRLAKPYTQAQLAAEIARLISEPAVTNVIRFGSRATGSAPSRASSV